MVNNIYIFCNFFFVLQLIFVFLFFPFPFSLHHDLGQGHILLLNRGLTQETIITGLFGF